MVKLPPLIFVVLVSAFPLFAQSKHPKYVKPASRPFYRAKSTFSSPNRPFPRLQKATKNFTAENNAIEFNKTRTDLLLIRAARYLSAGIESSFQRDVQRALRQDPDSEITLTEATRLLMIRPSRENSMEVEQIASEFIDRHPDNSPAFFIRSRNRVFTGDLLGALNDNFTVLDKDPDTNDYRNGLSGLFYRFINSDQPVPLFYLAMNMLEDRIESEQKPDSSRKLKNLLGIAHEARSRYYRKNGNTELQIADLTAFVELMPKSTLPLRERASAFMEAGRYTEAISDLTAASKFPQPFGTIDDAVYSLRAETYIRMGKFEEAIADYEKILDLYPSQKQWIEPKIAAAKQKLTEHKQN